MLSENNPFTPSFGRTPPYMAGRRMLLSDLAKAFRSNGNDPYLQTILMGARGTGKTALLTRACEIASGEGWVCSSTTCGQGMLEDLAQQAFDAAAHMVDTADRAKVRGVTFGQVLGVEWEPATEAPANWRTRITRLLEKLHDQDTGLLITVDEVRPAVAEMEQLASVFQHFVREGRRVALLMAGLPHHVSRLVNSDAVSFLRRSTSVTLGRIQDFEIEGAFERTVTDAGKSIEAEAIEECVDAIGGFPYMMQLVGFRAWDYSGEESTIALADARRGIAAAQDDITRQILLPTWASLSNGDKAFCQSLARGNQDAQAIAKDLGKKSNYVSKYKQRLLEQGVIEQDPYARLAFSIPGFEEFVQQAE